MRAKLEPAEVKSHATHCSNCGKPAEVDECFRSFHLGNAGGLIFNSEDGEVRLEQRIQPWWDRESGIDLEIRIVLYAEARGPEVRKLADIATRWNKGLDRFLDRWNDERSRLEDIRKEMEALVPSFGARVAAQKVAEKVNCAIRGFALRMAKDEGTLGFMNQLYFRPLRVADWRKRMGVFMGALRQKTPPKGWPHFPVTPAHVARAWEKWSKKTSKREKRLSGKS